ncbi:Endonuclease/exonuclease/phosphatase [Kalaharituber pfeilii]|nr:Endonuclease/exonuclease/phosphatase [Kalaharituber pfeilii]
MGSCRFRHRYSLLLFISTLALLPLTAAQTSGTFKFLTYNVAGLPDFAYHTPLVSSATHPYKTSTSGNVPFGSGLNTFSRYPYSSLRRITWNTCWFGSADCLTPKGFTLMRLSLAPGVNVDFYNLHAEAGDTDLDFAARRGNYEQLKAYIEQQSVGQAIVLGGDTNTRFYQAKDAIRLLTDNGPASLIDVWTQLLRGSVPPAPGSRKIECPFPNPDKSKPVDTTCELIDKVMYRSSPLVRLIPKSFLNENSKFLTPSGEPLSDHYPVMVPFGWELSPVLRVQGDALGYKEDGGVKRFTDLPASAASFAVEKWGGPYLVELALRHGARLDALSYTLSNGEKRFRGGNGGGMSPFVTLDKNAKETWTSIEACEAPVKSWNDQFSVVYLRAITSKGKVLEGGRRPTGAAKAKCSVWAAPGTGWTVVGFQGGSDGEIRNLEVVWGKVF